jgi:hypothetical protein
MDKIKGGFKGNSVRVGDKHLTVSNVEDISSYRIFIVDDVYELSPNENVYECTRIRFKYKGKITKFQN